MTPCPRLVYKARWRGGGSQSDPRPGRRGAQVSRRRRHPAGPDPRRPGAEPGPGPDLGASSGGNLPAAEPRRGPDPCWAPTPWAGARAGPQARLHAGGGEGPGP